MTTLFESGRNLEELYFKEKNDKALARLRELAQMKETCKALSDVSGITDEAVLNRLVALNVRPEILATLAAIPLVEVAWADGDVDEKERAAILRAAASVEFGKNKVDFPLLESWLDKKPSPALVEGWMHFVEGLAGVMDPRDLDQLRHDLLDRARMVAETAGGFLGIGKVSSSEQAVLDRMARAFKRKP